MCSTPAVALLLAAGAGRRLGLGPKALLPYRGRPLIEHALAVLRAGGCERIVVVLGAGAEDVLATAELGDCGVVRNGDWRTGMGSSLRAGLSALPADAASVLVALVDTPGLTPAAVARLLGADGLAAAAYGGRRGHPVVIPSRYWGEAADGAVGDAGARALFVARAGELVLVECGDVASGDDVDTVEQWERWRG
ncbi:nicotine blue oxidoreductase [Streptomyces sp. 846.5]|nr:nucleotidyltransferase family protein [Streptomyces sp. 846.5]TDT95827.1 nicotine blue oxidoreductase [Streptomyces sp. 846.5]